MRIFAFCFCLVVLNFLLAQSPPPDSAVDKAVQACNDFGFKLLAESQESLPGSNVFQSPLGLDLALAIVENGAKGATLGEMAAALQQRGIPLADLNREYRALTEDLAAPGQKSILEIANSLWIQQGTTIKPDFISNAKSDYQAAVENVDFKEAATVENINSWVSDKTHGKIPTMVTAPLDRDLRLIVLDAIYFKGAWAVPFDKSLTRDMPFTRADGTAATHPRMSQTGRLSYLENTEFQGVILPYAGSQISMVVLLPRAGLDKLIADLNPENWALWMSQFKPRQGTIGLPRLKIESTYELNSELARLGMSGAFTTRANLTGISDEPLRISWVKQKTYVEVNEEGTEAAAVSGIGIRRNALARPIETPFTMIVDRPFYLAIRDNQSGAILFHGAILDPN